MEIHPIKTPLLKPNFNLINVLKTCLPKNKINLRERDILIISSKIIALSQGRIVDLTKIKPSAKAKYLAKKLAPSRFNDSRLIQLIINEAQKIFPGKMILALKNNILIPNAGIDLSNAPKNHAILWPQNPWQTARNLFKEIKKQFRVKHLGLVIADSNCHPLRRGTIGLAVSWAGFEGISDQRGKKDLFGKKLKVTAKAAADNLASSALLLMGEAAEKTPMVLIRNAPVKFTGHEERERDFFVEPKECVFGGILNFREKKINSSYNIFRHAPSLPHRCPRFHPRH